MLKKRAAKKPETLNPSTNLSASKIITALITKIKSPNVTIVAGKVKNNNNGRTNIFNNAITTAIIIADTYPATDTPGKMVAKITTATAVSKIFKKVFMSLGLLCIS